MGKVEREFLNRANARNGEFKAPPFLPRARTKGLGTERLDGERYLTHEFMQAEWRHIWTKTWQLVTRVSDFDEAGYFHVHELGKESFLFVRGEDGEIRGFYNVCQHRGNRLCQVDIGVLETFTCPFHGWQWHNDGSLKQVAAPEFFPQFANGVPAAELGLPDYNVTTWYGLWTPKGTPADVQARAIEEVRKAAAIDEIKTGWANSGAEFPNLTGPQFGAFVNSEIKKWAVVVKASGAKLD